MRVLVEGAGLTGLSVCIVLTFRAIWLCAGETGVFQTVGLLSFLNCGSVCRKVRPS